MVKTSKALVIFLFSSLVVLIAAFLIRYITMVKEEHISFLDLTVNKAAQAVFENIVATRQWNKEHGGVFVKKRANIEPNPYLKENHVYTSSGEMLIRINPAWMTRQISAISNVTNEYTFNITSLNPTNPNNIPNAFEKEALNYLEQNQDEKYYFKYDDIKERYQFMGVLKAQESCLGCHQKQQYKLGQIVGGISISQPIGSHYNEFQNVLSKHENIVFIIIFISGIIIVGMGYIIHYVYEQKEITQNNLDELESLRVDNETLIRRYKYAVEGSQSGIWDWDLQSNKVYFDKNWKGMLGYGEDELNNDFKEWDMRVHPDDKEKAIQDIKDNQEQKTEYYLNVHRLRHKQGDWVWILDRGKTYFDKNGKAIRMVGFHTDISAFKELELQLYEKEQNLMTAQKIAQMGHWRYNAASDFFIASDALYKLLELPKEIKIKSYSDFKEFILEEDRENYLFQHKVIFQTKSKTNLQYRMKKFNSEEVIYIQEHISFVYNDAIQEESYIGTMQDITLMKKAEQELKLFKKILDNTPISIVITNKEAKLIYVNKHFCKVSGYTQKESLGKNPNILKSGNTSQEEYQKMWKTLLAKKTWGGIFKNVSKNNEEFWETALIIPVLDEDQQIVNYLGIKREITKELYLEKELKEKEELMLVQSKNAAMGEMISMIAHQWRQPITTISMMANNILADIELETFEEETAKTFAIELSKQTQYLSKTIEDFRNFFKQDKTTEETTLEDLFEDINSIILASLNNHNVELILNYDKSLHIKTYIRELLQVLINLIKNAKEAFDDTRVEGKFIKVDVSLEDEMLTIEVEDNAGGIAPEHLDKLFEAYFTTKEAHNGTGLGLYMSKMIVQKHLKGDLTVQNTQDGAQFKLQLQQFI